MNLRTWLDEERGRQKALAAYLGLTAGRVSQMADDGVPTKYMLSVRDFTEGAVTLESLVQDRTDGEHAVNTDSREVASVAPTGGGPAQAPTTSTCTPEQENNTSPSQPTERSVA